MRNRGIELFLLPPAAAAPAAVGRGAAAALADPAAASSAQDASAPAGALGAEAGAPAAAAGLAAEPSAEPLAAEDLQAMLVAEGVPGWALPAAMAGAHEEVARQAAARHRWPPRLQAWTRPSTSVDAVLSGLSPYCKFAAREVGKQRMLGSARTACPVPTHWSCLWAPS
jgi:hypothetical protein